MASTDSTRSQSTGIAGMSAYLSNRGTTTPNRPGHSNLFGALLGLYRPPNIGIFQEAGRRGTAVWGGYVENIEKDKRLYGQDRYRTASDRKSVV